MPQATRVPADGVMMRNLEGKITDWSSGAEDLYGWKKEDAIGKVSHELLHTKFPRPLPEIESEVVEKGRWQGRLVHATRTGGQVVVESRWIMEATGEPGTLVEINTLCTSPDAGLKGAGSPADRSGSAIADRSRRSAQALEQLAKAANVVLIAGGTLAVLAFLYFFYHYGLRGDRLFTSGLGAALYYGLPALLALLLFGALGRAPVVRIGIALAFLSASISVYTLELVLFFFNPPALFSNATLRLPARTAEEVREVVRVARSFGVDFDVRTKLEVINDLRDKGVDAFPSIVPAQLLKPDRDGVLQPLLTSDGVPLLPLAGIAHKVTVLCNETGQHLAYVSDEHGFHNPQGLWNSGRTEIVGVGDSYVHGICVPAHANFMYLLRERHPATVNLGIAGDGPLLELATLMEYAPHLKPQKVLWFFYEGNDLENLRSEAKAPFLMRYLQPGYRQSLIYMQPQIDAALMSHVETIRADLLEDTQRLRETNQATWHPAALVSAAREILSLGNMRRRLGLIYGTTRDAEQSVSFEEEAALLASILRAAKETAQEWGGNVYFVYLPARERYVDSSLARSMDDNRVRVLAVARSAALPVIDIHRVFEAHGDPLSLFPFRRTGHYNELGNQLVAQEVLKSISSDHRPEGG